jgi:hypothetical protein
VSQPERSRFERIVESSYGLRYSSTYGSLQLVLSTALDSLHVERLAFER